VLLSLESPLAIVQLDPTSIRLGRYMELLSIQRNSSVNVWVGHNTLLGRGVVTIRY
jgi:hypothetical protein